MQPIVIDASVLAKPFLAEDGWEVVERAMDQLELWAPALIYYEVGNAICRRVRGEGIAPGPLIDGLWKMRIHSPGSSVWATAAADVAVREGLSYYDASYISVAQKLRLGLWTEDQRMSEVARAAGVQLYVRGTA